MYILILQFNTIKVWLPCSILIGFITFSWTILLHECIHNLIFQKRKTYLQRTVGMFYAILGGLAFSQFKKWHLDHHAELGSETADPKRAHLTPKIITRWYKLLYMTPLLFPIYFRASSREIATYSPKLVKKIRKEQLLMLISHLVLTFALIYFADVYFWIKVYLIPYLFVFPFAFTINRLGQHYNIDKTDPLKWTTYVKGSLFWDFIYIYSNYHLEHHCYPDIPCYNLPKLQKQMQPLYDRHKLKPQGYLGLLYGWFIENKKPHTKW